MRVLVAMSGGVDSSVVAARMVEQGYDVSGVYLNLTRKGDTGNGCSKPRDVEDAARVAKMLGIELDQWNLADQFDDLVISPWVAGYQQGLTPNPCLLCNRTIKFAALQNRALELGFDMVATGHYARLVNHDGVVSLYRAKNIAKDQSYVLSVLNQHQLSHAIFPLGEMETKEQVRQEAERRGLPVAKKPDSYDICFIPDGNTAGFLDGRIGEQEGKIVDQSGNVLGSHLGSHHFTVGQRKGLAIGRPAPDGNPRYVLKIEPKSNTVIVGSKQDLQIDTIVGEKVSWTETPITEPWRGLAQVRAHGTPLPAIFEYDGNQVVAKLDTPANNVAAGQGLVIYDGDRVVGSSTVKNTSLETS